MLSPSATTANDFRVVVRKLTTAVFLAVLFLGFSLPAHAIVDNTYCKKNDIPNFGASGVDGPATLPQSCIYTGTDGTPSPNLPVHSVSDAAGLTAILNSSTLKCGDVIEIVPGATALSGNFILPPIHCNINQWITVRSSHAAPGVDANFPAEGIRATPCHIQDNGAQSVPYYPAYPCTVSQVGRRMPKIQTPNGLAAISITPCATQPCTSFWRFIGIEVTNTAGIRTPHKLIEFDGGDHMILDRSVVHGTDAAHQTVRFDQSYETQGGVSINGTYMAVIDSWIYDIICVGFCVDSQGVAGGTGPYAQRAHKIVDNMIAATGESWFWGGGQHIHSCNDWPDGTHNVHCTTTDIEVRRNHSFKPLSWMLVKGGSGNHPIVKNLGETKASDRALWEGNVAENSWTGWQTDQFGNAHLITPKNQSVIVQPGGRTMQMAVDNNGRVFVWCDNCTASGGTAGTGNFTCDADATQTIPANGGLCDPTTAGGSTMAAFVDATGNLLPGGYLRSCPTTEVHGSCRLVTGGTNGNRYHIRAFNSAGSNGFAPAPPCSVGGTSVPCPTNLPSTDIYELWADEINTGFPGNTGSLPLVGSATSYTFCKRGADPYAQVWNLTNRYDLDRHSANLYEVFSAESGCGDNGLGVHNVSIHDIVAYDINAQFWVNAVSNGCCDLGWNLKLSSDTKDPSVVPSNISYFHNSVALIGWGGSNHSGMVNWFDARFDASKPISSANPVTYFPGITVRDNISAGPFAIAASGIGINFLCSSLGGCSGVLPTPTSSVAQGLGIFGCLGHDGTTGCDAVMRKNLLLQGLLPTSQNAQLENIPDKTNQPVDLCSISGTNNRCDRSPTNGYADIFTTYDPKGGPTTNLALPSGSQYKLQATDNADLGANVVMVNSKTSAVAQQVNYGLLAHLVVTTTSLPPASSESHSITASALTSNIVTLTTAVTNHFTANQSVTIAGLTHLPSGANGPQTLTGATPTTISYAFANPDVAPGGESAATIGALYMQLLAASGGASPFQAWSITSGSLPAGLSLINLNGVVIAGTPTTAGPYSFTVQAEDGAHQTATQPLSITVN